MSLLSNLASPPLRGASVQMRLIKFERLLFFFSLSFKIRAKFHQDNLWPPVNVKFSSVFPFFNPFLHLGCVTAVIGCLGTVNIWESHTHTHTHTQTRTCVYQLLLFSNYALEHVPPRCLLHLYDKSELVYANSCLFCLILIGFFLPQGALPSVKRAPGMTQQVGCKRRTRPHAT